MLFTIRNSMLLALGLALAASAAAGQQGPEKGSLVIVGGALRDNAILERFISLAGGPEAPIVIIPTAGGEDDYDAWYAGARRFRNLGATNITVLHTWDREEAESEEFAAPITKARGFRADGNGGSWMHTPTPAPSVNSTRCSPGAASSAGPRPEPPSRANTSRAGTPAATPS